MGREFETVSCDKAAERPTRQELNPTGRDIVVRVVVVTGASTYDRHKLAHLLGFLRTGLARQARIVCRPGPISETPRN